MDTPLSGILPLIYSAGNQAKRGIYGLLGDPMGFLGSLGQDLQTQQDERRKALTTLLSPGVFTTPQEKNAAMGAMTQEAMNLLAPTVYHGSPHKFDKFDSSKIGTGEGAQAYAHGLYFAEKPQVAMEYKKNLSYKDAVKQFRQELPDDADFEEVLALAASGQVSAPKARVIKELAANDWLGFDYPAQAITAAFRDKAGFHDMTPSLRKAIDEYGNLYKVDLPDSMAAKMLDWDKPLSQQPEIVRKLKDFAVADDRSLTGGQFIRKQVQEYGADPAEFSAALNTSGIPGVRYLDANSRVTSFDPRDTGTRNYVVFPGNEGLLTILERNGVPLQGLLGQ